MLICVPLSPEDLQVGKQATEGNKKRLSLLCLCVVRVFPDEGPAFWDSEVFCATWGQ